VKRLPCDLQDAAEALGAVVSLACVLTPSVGWRLEEARGVVARPASGTQLFLLSDSLTAAESAEVAWSTYGATARALSTDLALNLRSPCCLALLSNSNARAVVLLRGGRVLCARGELPWLRALRRAEGLALVEERVRDRLPCAPVADALLLSDGDALADALTSPCVLVQPLAGAVDLSADQPLAHGALLLLGDSTAAFGAKARAWVRAVAVKLDAVLAV
jgi:hypothetical protein